MNRDKRVVRRGAEKASNALYFARKHKEKGSWNAAVFDSLIDSYQTTHVECFFSTIKWSVCICVAFFVSTHPELSVRLCALGL